MCIVRLHVDNTIAEKQRMSPQTYPAMGLGVGGGAARFPSSPGPTPPGGLLPTGALNTSSLHLERRDTSGTLDCPGSLQNVHICSATSGVHSQAPCGQYYCRETVNVSTNLPSNGAGGGRWGRQVSFVTWPHPPRRASPHQRQCPERIWSGFEREETQVVLWIFQAHYRMYIYVVPLVVCIVRLHVDNPIAEKQRMSPQIWGVGPQGFFLLLAPPPRRASSHKGSPYNIHVHASDHTH